MEIFNKKDSELYGNSLGREEVIRQPDGKNRAGVSIFTRTASDKVLRTDPAVIGAFVRAYNSGLTIAKASRVAGISHDTGGRIFRVLGLKDNKILQISSEMLQDWRDRARQKVTKWGPIIEALGRRDKYKFFPVEEANYQYVTRLRSVLSGNRATRHFRWSVRLSGDGGVVIKRIGDHLQAIEIWRRFQ